MQNRYDDILRINNEAIIKLSPANDILRYITALEFKRHYKAGMRVLELGCGEGDSARDILKLTDAPIDMLDISAEMIEQCKTNLVTYIKNLNFICSDASTYLRRCDPYEIIASSWTLHNLKQSDKKEVLQGVYGKLSENGVFILMDKVYPATGGRELFDLQMKRYRYLDPDVAKEIVAHEEMPFLSVLKQIGFKNVQIIDRVERDIVLLAYK